MSANWFLTSRSLLLSIALHCGIGFVLVFNFEFSPTPPPATEPAVNIIDAVSVDKNQVERELKRLQEKEDAEKTDELKRKKELRELKKQQKKRKEAELKRKKEEQNKKELEKKRKLKEQKKVEAKRKKQEADAKHKAEKERKQNERKKQLQEQLAEELAAEQERQDLSEIEKFTNRIARAVEARFNKLGLPDSLSCVILIRLLESGKVADVSIARSSGNDLFDNRAESAVYAASPLPVPDAKRIFRKMRTIEFTFKPRN